MTITEHTPAEKFKLYTLAKPSTVYLQCLGIVVLVLLAFSGWIGGGDPSTIEIGARAYIEIVLVVFSLGLTVVLWGPDIVFKGLKSPTFIVLIIFCAWAVLSSFWSISLFLSIGKSIELVLTVLVGGAVAYQVKAAKISLVKIIQNAMLVVVFILLMVNLIQFNALIPFLFTHGRKRLMLGFEHPNVAAVYFLIIILFGVYQIVTQREKRVIVIQSLISIFFLVLLVLTDSRTTLVGLFMGIALLLFLRILQIRIQMTLGLFFLILLFVAALILFSGALDQIVKGFVVDHPDFITLNGRIPLWKAVLSNVKDFSFAGTGYFTSRLLLLSDFKWGSHAHNSFIEILVTTGFVGLILFVSFYFSTLFSVSTIRQFSLPFVYLVVMTIQSLTAVSLFVPGATMFVTVLLMVYQQYAPPTPGISANDSLPLSAPEHYE